MKKVFFAILAVALVLATAGCVAPQSEGLSITNTDGTVTVIPEDAERIVLLNSNAGEILYLLGEADKVVGGAAREDILKQNCGGLIARHKHHLTVLAESCNAKSVAVGVGRDDYVRARFLCNLKCFRISLGRFGIGGLGTRKIGVGIALRQNGNHSVSAVAQHSAYGDVTGAVLR